MMIYKDPQFEKGHIFPAKRLPGAVDVPRTLRDMNLDCREVSQTIGRNSFVRIYSNEIFSKHPVVII